MKCVRLSFFVFLVLILTGFQSPPSQEKAKVPPQPVLQGTVFDSEDNPVEGALVLTQPRMLLSPEQPLSTRTDSEGRFRIPLASDKFHRVWVEAEGYASWVERRVQPGKDLEIILEGGSFIEGNVFNGDTLKPVAGARVEVSREDRGIPAPSSQPRLGILEAETDDEGHFHVQGVAQTLHSVAASARGYSATRKSSVRPGNSVELFLFAGASVIGTVTAPDDAPVEGAAVQLWIKDRDDFRRSGSAQRSDSNGRFSIFGAEPGKHRLVVRHRDFAPAITPIIDVQKNEEAEVDILLRSGTSVSGRLVDEAEQPVQGRLSLEFMDGEPSSLLLSDLRAETSEMGHFTFRRLPPGAHTLSVEASGYAQKSVDVAIGDREEPIDLGDIMLETGIAIRGRVVDSSGQVVEGAMVSAFSNMFSPPVSGQLRLHRATTDAEGNFTLAGLREGTYSVRVRAQGYAPQEKDPVDVGDSVTFVLGVAGSISGVVVDEDRRPIESYEVRALPMERRSRSMGMDRVFDPEGAFLMTDLAAGTYVVEINAPDLLPETVSDVQVESGVDTHVGVVRLKKGGSVQGHVVDPSGLPIPGASVRAAGPGLRLNRAVSASTTNGDGFFEMHGLPEGQTELVAQHPNYTEGRAGLTIDSKMGPTETRILLGFGGALEGWLRGRDGSGIPGRIVTYTPQRPHEPVRVAGSRDQMTAETGPDGHFRIENVPVGRGSVQVTPPSGMRVRVQGKEVEIFEGETTYIDLESRQILVHGQITEGGAPAPGLQLMLFPLSGGGVSVSVGPGPRRPALPGPRYNYAVTREDGTYELLVDQPGEYSAAVQHRDGGRPAGRTVEIPDTDTFSLNLDFGGIQVIGMVLDKKSEEPVAGARVHASPAEHEPGTVSYSATTGPDGGFQLEIEPGKYTITASAEGYARTRKTLSVGSTAPPDVILLLSAGLSIRGIVTDERGQGVGDLPVLGTTGAEKGASMGIGVTMADGSFLMEELEAKPYNLLVSTRMGTFAFEPGVRPGSEDVMMTLQPGGRVVIQAWDGNHVPVKDARVSLSAINGIPVFGVGSSTDDGGHCELPVPAGYLELTISNKNLEAKETFNVFRGASIQVEVVLQPKTSS